MMPRFWPRLRLWVALLAVLTAATGAVFLVPQPTVANTKGEQAVNWMLARQGSTAYQGLCEQAVENAFGTSGRYPSARVNWNTRVNAGHARTPALAAPRGALVFYDTGPNGHVAISLGDGSVASTSTQGEIGVVPISYFRNPLGWAYASW